MDNILKQGPMNLPEGALLRVRRDRAKGIAVLHGVLWITQEGDPRDIFVGAGESFIFDGYGLLVIEALEASNVLVFAALPQRVSAAEPIGYEAAWPGHLTLNAGEL